MTASSLASEARPVVGFGSEDYLITADGMVISRRTKNEKVVGGWLHSSGHRMVRLRTNEDAQDRYVHELVLEAFVGPKPDGKECRHLNGEPDDNRVENLAWGTHQENMRDMLTHGTNHNAIKTHCKRGHEFTDANTYRFGPQNKWRNCIACIKLRRTAA